MGKETWRGQIRYLFTLVSWKMFLFFSGLTAEEYRDEIWRTETQIRNMLKEED